MANRDPEPESAHQQFSEEYLAKYGDPGPVKPDVDFKEIAEDIAEVVAAIVPEPVVSVDEPVVAEERETVVLTKDDVGVLDTKKLFRR